jgi:hypothetical protein
LNESKNHMKIKNVILLTLFLISSNALSADSRCQCSSKDWLGDCTARFERTEKFIKFISSTQQCSIVYWYRDEHPELTVVTDGAEMEELPDSYKVTIDSCKICKDSKLNTVSDQQEPPISLSGAWNSVQTCSYGTGTSVMNIIQNESGGVITGRLANATIDEGKIEVRNITIKASNWHGNKIQMEGKLIGSDKIIGTYTQTARSGVCQWEANKQ